MTDIRFCAMSTDEARHFQSGGADAYGMVPERRTSDGDGVPCRAGIASRTFPQAKTI